jgi:hypothetical protein
MHMQTRLMPCSEPVIETLADVERWREARTSPTTLRVAALLASYKTSI